MRASSFCGYLWLLVILISMGVVALGFSGGRIVASLCGLFSCLLSIFIGMLTSSIMERSRRVTKTSNEYKEMSLRISRVLADRVSDRLVAKMSGLHNDEQREAIFGDADKIIDEEMNAMKEAIDSIEEEILQK